MPLDLTPLRNAIGQLREGIKRHLAEPTAKQPRDGRVRRFAFTCQLSHKLLRRYLREILPTAEDAGRMSVSEFARAGNDRCPLRANGRGRKRGFFAACPKNGSDDRLARS